MQCFKLELVRHNYEFSHLHVNNHVQSSPKYCIFSIHGNLLGSLDITGILAMLSIISLYNWLHESHVIAPLSLNAWLKFLFCLKRTTNKKHFGHRFQSKQRLIS